MAKQDKKIYYFGKTKSDGTKEMKELLGGKGANLAEMTSIGLPVPPGFTITTETCAEYNKIGGKLPDGLMDDVHKNMQMVEKETGKNFGSNENPLLVSVRSGAAVSMPGMMDTVLNLGLNDAALEGLIAASDNRRFALDAYRRLINMFGDVVMGVDHEHFEEEFDKIKAKYGVSLDTELGEDGLVDLIHAYKEVYKNHTGEEFPQDPFDQLEKAIEAVFKSWNIPRAVEYRRINEITGLLGTAVNVQTMVFGNMGEDSGTGVAFTRNPSTGENKFYGEFLVNAQGEDVVAGIRTPQPVAEMSAWRQDIYEQLLEVKNTLESHYQEMEDFEFTIETSTLYMLQTRTGKRTGQAAVKIAVDMVGEKLVSEKVGVTRVPPNDLNQLLLPTFDPKAQREVLTTGLPASPGAACGKLAFTAEDAVHRSEHGESVLLVRKETSPEDISGMHMAAGILTSTGGMTSHAAVVARGWGKCCVAGAGEIIIDEKNAKITVNGRTFGEEDTLSIDGSSGEVMAGEIPRLVPELSGDFATLMNWADKYRRLRIRTNADTPEDATRARNFGAEGIGLCRTEHMFFEGDRITAMREMILAEAQDARRAALAKLLPYQREDFEGIFTAMRDLPVTVRLLDPPLHEFLPQDAKSQAELAGALGISAEYVSQRVEQLHELNPMLGHRGCRLSVTYPEILDMQVQAITEAAINCRNNGVQAMPEIMIPLVGVAKELAILRAQAVEVIERTKKEKGFSGDLPIPVGTMIEIPRAALTADQVAQHADFFSFGTNDLTQMTFGFSRDDIGTFLPEYLRLEIFDRDPFQGLDASGVGQLVEMGVKKGRSTKKDLKVGICGEHGGDPASISFCDKAGLDYVSCSPFRVSVARLAAAQSALEK
uniref:Pyruvate, phosphate dikinase n=1 Tax=Candidatus Kentrum sp. FM TaxID=2126340 RepID=A0A450W421_9GAMM|nr:MAG: pyruvate, orthophosphate dikinase [Candidatus Kentron sp. FM]VFJ56244.1 MAG: pyruvate, orthophosphate dikinase [Candidatus Kentron sp. FM]VFK11770.1 MAG: pyruvate, orthophosphate dikinase [Candidatus Kentron sp. FM]